MSLIEHLLDRIFSKKVIVNCDRDPYLQSVVRYSHRSAWAVYS